MSERPMTAAMQDAMNRLNQSPAVHPDLRPMDLMLKGAIQRGGELVAENDRLRARVAELEAGLESCAESLELALSRLGCPTQGNNGGAFGHDADDMGGIRALEDAQDLLNRY